MKKIMILVLLAAGLASFIGCTETTTSTNTEQTTIQTTDGVTTVSTEMTTIESTTNETTSQTTLEPVDLSVSSSKPYLFININETILLSEYVYRTLDGPITLDQAVISNASDGLLVESGSLTALTEGMHTFDFAYGEEGIMVYVFAKAVEDTDYLVYSKSFTDTPDGDLPDSYTIETVGLGSTGIENGYLYVDSPDIGDPTRVLLPQYLDGFKNYIIDVDFTILTALEEGRWASVMYRFSPANYFQMCIRQGATATNGVEFAKALNGQWNVPKTVAYSENIDPASIYHLTVDLFGATAKEYINDELLIEYNSARDFSNGSIGVQSSGAKAIFNNFEIRIPESYIDYTTIEYQNVPSVYTSETNIIMAPTVVQVIETQSDIDQLAQEVRGSTALFDINPSLDAINDSSEKLLSFIDILEATKDRTIPAFRTTLPFVAHNLAVKIEELGLRDVVLISTNVSAIQRAREDYDLIRGVLQINYDSDVPILNDDDLLEIRNNTNIAGAVAVLLPVEYGTRYNVDYLQRRLVTVWINTEGISDVGIIQSIVSGANGLVSSDALNVYDIFDMFPENTLFRLPLIIGHRGMPSKGPENTVEGAALALAAGADIVELDIYLTTDNKIVVMHDRTTERTTDGNLIVEDSTLAELRALTILDHFGTFPNIPVPTLEEYFQRFSGEDLQLFIEIKSTNANIVPVLKALIEEYDFYDQAMVITFHVAQAEIVRELIPEISVGLLNSGLVNAENLSSSITATLNQIVPLKSTLNPQFAAITMDFMLAMQHRGITLWPWTTNNEIDFMEQLTSGIGGISTDHTYWYSDEFVKFWVPTTEFEYSISGNNLCELMGSFGNPSGFEYPFPATLEIIGGGETGITFGARNSIAGATTTGDVYILPSFTTTLSDGSTITLYADVIHVLITE